MNPLLAYLLAKRLSSPAGGLTAAALVALLAANAKGTSALNIDAPLLTFYLLALLALLAAMERDSSVLALLSGMLLGVSILTKETALASLPLALAGVLLLGWELRGAFWHYAGVVLACLPWWVWVYSATKEIYLLDRLPTPLQGLLLVAAAISSVFVAAAYASGMVDRFVLAHQRRRLVAGWVVVALWSCALSATVLATATHALSRATLDATRAYLADVALSPPIVVVPALLLVIGYTCYKALGRSASLAWRLVGVALIFQVPVCFLVVVERWAVRQFLIPQTLLLCVLAALVVGAAGAALNGERAYPARLVGAFVGTVVGSLVVVACVDRAGALLPENPARVLSEERPVAPQETRMVDWMARNVPEGEPVLVVAEPAVNVAQANYMIFLDGGRHEWIKLRLDRGVCLPRPNVQRGCDPARNDVSRIPSEAIWVQTVGGCKFISLSMSNLLEQVNRNPPGYVMVAGSQINPDILQLPAALLESEAFEVAHAGRAPEGQPGGTQEIVLLERTGEPPRAQPTQMNARTVRSIKRCEQAKGAGSKEAMRSRFPGGIRVVSD